MLKGRKLVTLLIALVAAGLLWLYVVSTVAPEVTSRVSYIPVNIDGTIVLEERGLMVTDQATRSITLELKTSRLNLSKLNASSIRISADVSKLREPGTYDLSYSIQFPDLVNSNDVDIIRKSNNRVIVTVARKETKSVPVTVNWSGTEKEGYSAEIGSAEINPLEIVLEGPDYEVSKVTEARIDFDYSDLTQTVYEQSVPVTFCDTNGNAVNLTELTSVSAREASLTLQVLRAKEIELKVQLNPGGGVQTENADVTIDPPTVFIKGSKETIEGMDVLNIGTPIELSEILEESTYSFNVVVPPGVIIESGETTANVTVRLHGLKTEKIKVDDIRVENLADAFKYTKITNSATVSIRGSEEEIASVMESGGKGFYIVLDLSTITGTGRVETNKSSITYRIVSDDHPTVYATLVDQIAGMINTKDQPVPED